MRILVLLSMHAHLEGAFRPVDFAALLVISALNLQVLRRGLAAVRHFLVFDHLALIEGGQTSPLDRGNMDEDILAATTLRLDEPVAFGRVEPFHSSCSHLWSPS